METVISEGGFSMIKMNYCSKCVYPQIGVNLSFDDDGVS